MGPRCLRIMDITLTEHLLCRGPLLWQQPEQLLWRVVAAPPLEEWVIRAGLQEYLLRRAPPPAARTRLASVLFASLAFCAVQEAPAHEA